MGRFRFFFFSREERRPHVHIEGPSGEAKFWVEPEVELAFAWGFSARIVRRLEGVVHERRREIRQAWQEHFGS
ncbi:MAG TPA: DUF4160 domain-containing protein [Candidatus Eisenbacteria bacterium]|nr:DUF4160 domain-containing protein [Candidatus Eisenbacteria bacterium]